MVFTRQARRSSNTMTFQSGRFRAYHGHQPCLHLDLHEATDHNEMLTWTVDTRETHSRCDRRVIINVFLDQIFA